ncbi:hypothetical protein [Turneriella parva]|uniref:hypothetical protein n=1 Tax=Turneriella parva TaxID=29510 RepID=UPI0012F69662|nr:hypothetical protein [Turneriella parva]
MPAGALVEFETDWKHEKKKWDGKTRYGSHLRKITNKGTHMIIAYLRTSPTAESQIRVFPGTSESVKGDLLALEAAPEPLAAADLQFRCNVVVERSDNMHNGKGRPSASLGKEQFSLRLGEMIIFDTDWQHEKKKSAKGKYYGPHLRRLTGTTSGARVNVRTISPLPAEMAKRVGLGVRKIIDKSFQGTELQPGVPMEFQADLLSLRCSR